jgi:hypothetical protein
LISTVTSRLADTVGWRAAIEIERSSSTEWQVIANVAANTNSFNLTNFANDTYSSGSVVSMPDKSAIVTNRKRSQRHCGSTIEDRHHQPGQLSHLEHLLVGGVWQQDVSLINNSTQAYVPFVDFSVIAVSSASGNVRVINSTMAVGQRRGKRSVVQPQKLGMINYSARLKQLLHAPFDSRTAPLSFSAGMCK